MNTDQLSAFLEWLRLPENNDLYMQMLSLQPIMFDQLTARYGEQMRSQKISCTAFADAMDRLHVTYCLRNNNNQQPQPSQPQLQKRKVTASKSNIDQQPWKKKKMAASPAPITPIIDVQVLKQISLTPIPDYASMSDKELADELERNGLRPLGRNKAVGVLNQIYDVTHPELSATTPVSRKVSRLLKETSQPLMGKEAKDAAREKRTKKAIAQMEKETQRAKAIQIPEPDPDPVIVVEPEPETVPASAPVVIPIGELWDYYRPLMNKKFKQVG